MRSHIARKFFSFHFSETRTACQTKSSCLKVISRGNLEKELNRLNIPPSHRFDAVICKGHFLFFGAKKIRFEGKIRRHFFKKLILWPINRGFTTGASQGSLFRTFSPPSFCSVAVLKYAFYDGGKKGFRKRKKKMKQVREKSLNLKTLSRRMRMFHFLNQKSCHSVTRSDEEKKKLWAKAGNQFSCRCCFYAQTMHNNYSKRHFGT